MIVNLISNIISKNNNTPTLNIESFGVNKNVYENNNQNYLKYYIASLDFKVKSLFRNYTKTVYLPILFESEKPIKDLFVHYNNIYFEIELSTIHYNIYAKSELDKFRAYTQKTKLYHISEIINLDKLYNKLFINYRKNYKINPNEFYINLYINYYKGCKISIHQHIINEYRDLSSRHIYNYIRKDDNTNCIECIKNDYNEYRNTALFDYFCISEPEIIFNNANLELIITKIDKVVNEREKENKMLNKMYSKKSFKLIES